MKTTDTRADERRTRNPTGVARATPAGTPPTVMPGRYALTEDDCRALLLDVGWGILSVVEEERPRARKRPPASPFSVPVAYALDAGAIYLATGGGRKLAALEANPRLCLTVSDVQGFDRWRTVVLVGTARWVDESRERGRAIQSFAIQKRPHGYALGPDDARRFLGARILRIEIDELHGMARGSWGALATLGEPGHLPAEAGATEREALPPMPLPAGELDGDATRTMQSIRRLFRALRAAGDEAHRAAGLTPAQLWTLRQLALRPGQTVSELARRTLTTQSTVSEVVARLVARGLVSREVQSDDRRRTHLTLTAEGSALIAAAPEPIQERLVRAFQSLPADERRTLARVLELWVLQAGLAETPATMFFEPNGG